jgi:hypothetical protein
MRVHFTLGARRASFALLAAASAACASADGGDRGPTAVVPAIRVVAAAAPVALSPGATVQAAVTVSRAGGYRGAVALAVAGAPSGVTASLSPATLGDDDTESVLSVRAAADAAPGRYDLAVTGSGPGVHAAAATLTLTLAAASADTAAAPVPAPVPAPAPPPPAPPPAPAPAAPLDGIYLGVRTNLDGRQYQDYWTFLPNGRVVDADPYEGLDRPLRLEQLCQAFPCGTYARNGGELRIRWGESTEARVYDLDAQGAFNERGKTQKYRPLAPLNGLRLAATFGEVDGAGGGARLQLAADGRFEEERLMHYTAWAQLGAPGEARTALAGGRGHYTIERNTLALRYDGGQAAYFTIVVPPGEIGKPVPDVVYVNTARLARVP